MFSLKRWTAWVGLASLCMGLGRSGLCSAAAKIPPLKNKTGIQTTLGIPITMADVKEGYLPRGQRRLHYVLIEDVHDNPEAQGKIAAILLYAHHHWGSRQAFVEGAFDRIGPPPFPIFTAERGERSVNELLQLGLFSGGELAAALAFHSRSPERVPFDVIGMDDRELYMRQLSVFEEISSRQTQALRHLDAMAPRLSLSEMGSLRRLLQLQINSGDSSVLTKARWAKLNDPLLRIAVERCQEYYRLADLRSRQFSLRLRERRGNGPCLLVMGGYHTAEVSRILRERHESFIVLSPQLRQSTCHARYQERLSTSLETLQRFSPNSPYSSPVGFLRLTLAHKKSASATD